jgi:60kDa lysophospholipase
VVLETFGAGNAPQRADLIEALKEARARGVVIVAISQCPKGSVSNAYETGRTLQAVGIASGGDMTTEVSVRQNVFSSTNESFNIQCALAKLAYLLSKADKLSSAEVHALMQIPLRGELTLPPALSVQGPSAAVKSATSPETFGNLLNHITRLCAPQSLIPSVQVTSTHSNRAQSSQLKVEPSMTLLGSTVALSKSAREMTSSWQNTATETASAEAALYPFLVHIAVAKDDVDTLKFCLGITKDATTLDSVPSPIEGLQPATMEGISISSNNRNLVQGGIANCVDVASGRTPLHVAALNGSIKCTKVLLESGALIHIRDSLDHTALYYVSFPSHKCIHALINRSTGRPS